jgi:hypothetical protein
MSLPLRHIGVWSHVALLFFPPLISLNAEEGKETAVVQFYNDGNTGHASEQQLKEHASTPWIQVGVSGAREYEQGPQQGEQYHSTSLHLFVPSRAVTPDKE